MFGIGEDSNKNSSGDAGSNFVPTPYLNIDPNYLRGGDEYILMEDASPVRSRVQLMFSVVGTATVAGAFLGGLESMRYSGLQLLKGKSERMQTTSAVLKNGGKIAQKFGSVAVLYCACSVISEKSRGVEDEYNTLVGATAAGFLYSLPGCINVKKHGSPTEEIERLGFIRKNLRRLPPAGRLLFGTTMGFLVGGLLCFNKTNSANFIRDITSKT